MRFRRLFASPYLRARRQTARFRKPKIWPELVACFRREIAIGSDAISKFGRRVAFCPDTRGEARRRRQARSAHAIEAERGARRPRWRPPEAARDLRPHGVLRRRLVAGEVCRLQALPRVTALLTALLLAPQAGWPCQHAVLALPRPRRLDGSFAGRQESGQSAASPLHCVLTLTRRAHTWRTRSSTCRAATAPTSSPPEAQARSHTSSVRRASLSVPQQEGRGTGLPPVPALARSEVNYFHSLGLGPASWSTRASPVHQE